MQRKFRNIDALCSALVSGSSSAQPTVSQPKMEASRAPALLTFRKNPPQEGESHQHSLLRSNKGGLQALMLMILPLLIFMAGGVASLMNLSFFISKERFICRNEILNSQVRSGAQIAKLLSLNPRAMKLEISLALEQARLVSCTSVKNAPCAADAMAKIAEIKGKQQDLDAQQKHLILSKQMEIKKGLLKIRSQLRTQRSLLLTSSPENFMEFSDSADSVRAHRPGIAPTYQLATEFSEKQKAGLTWTKNISLPLLGWQLKSIDMGCAASLKEMPFYAVLRGVKHSRKSFLY